jgi:hypothetical protein
LYLLRVWLPDRPGALGQLASAIGAAGGDITSLDVVERTPATAIDDVLIDVPGELAEAVLLSVGGLDGVVVETWQPFTEGNQLHASLEVVDALGLTNSRALAAIVRIAPAVLRARWVVIVDAVEGGIAVTQGSADAPWTRWATLPWFPPQRAVRLDGDPSWLPHGWGAEPELAAAPIAGSCSALVAVRPTGPQFRLSEVDRLSGLAAIAALTATGAP